MRIAILSPSITAADAVSNDALGMREALMQGSTGEVHLFAEGSTIQDESVRPTTGLTKFLRNPEDLLIYHYARGWPPGIQLLNELRCRKVIKYHNITPPEFFLPYSEDLSRLCREGRAELALISRSSSQLFLADSAYNREELIEKGAPAARTHILPPFHHTDRLLSTRADAPVLAENQNGKITVCTVGRVVPNKGHLALIQAFAAYHYGYNRQSRLVIIGREEMRLRSYSLVLRELIRRLNLDRSVEFTGRVSDSALKGYYESASVFLTTSNHEGFCVPLIEAMAMGVPIIAYATSAIPETVGPAGIVWEERNPDLLAASIDRVVSDSAKRAELVALGKRRYAEQFSNETIASRFLAFMQDVIAR